MKTHTYTVKIEPGEDGKFVVSVPALPGCFSQGDTFDEAVAMARECIEGFLEALVKAGEPIPLEVGTRRPHIVTVGVRVPTHIAAVAGRMG